MTNTFPLLCIRVGGSTELSSNIASIYGYRASCIILEGSGNAEASPNDEENLMDFTNLKVSSLLESFCKSVLINATDSALFC